jgi:endonuclease YncB( thermonuclease family)
MGSRKACALAFALAVATPFNKALAVAATVVSVGDGDMLTVSESGQK